MIAMTLCALCLLGGAWAVQRRSAALLAAACAAGVAAVLTHTLSGLAVLGLLAAGSVAAAIAGRTPLSRGTVLTFAATGLVLAGIAVYLVPLMHGWNAGQAWGYSPAHSAMAAAVSLGWPVAVLAAVGAVLFLAERNAQNWYWLTAALGWGVFTVSAPLVVTYHPAYAFPIALGALVLAGTAVGRVYELLAARNGTVAVAWLLFACLLNLPSVVSHYADGSRPDYRTAARFVADRIEPGDRITARSASLFTHYAPACTAEPLGVATIDSLRKQTARPGRLWIVIQSARGGLPDDVRAWLGKYCSHEMQVCRNRFDYPENRVDVFLWPGAGVAECPVAGEQRVAARGDDVRRAEDALIYSHEPATT